MRVIAALRQRLRPVRRRLRPLERLVRRIPSYPAAHPVRQGDLIDVYLTTHRRPEFLARCMERLMQACRESPFRHRITVMVDAVDRPTLEVLDPYLEEIFLVTTPTQLGLPFMYNLILDHSDSLSARSEESPRLLCYLQDDCLITAPDEYFAAVVAVHDSVPGSKVGYVSGFYTPLHPGFELTSLDGMPVIRSDSIDGKNLVGTPELFRSVGRLPWYFLGGGRRGNPSPGRGSQFDIWQWRESPTSTVRQGRICLVVPGLVQSMAQSAEESTWDNPGDSQERIAQMVSAGDVYATRGHYPTLGESDFFTPDSHSQGRESRPLTVDH